jgi:hypothetical protein
MGRSGRMVRGCAPKEYRCGTTTTAGTNLGGPGIAEAGNRRGRGIAEGRSPRKPALGARSETSEGYFCVRMTAVLMIGPPALPSRTRSV